jgi:hypothetical protein
MAFTLLNCGNFSGADTTSAYIQCFMGSVYNCSYLFQVGGPDPVSTSVRVAHGLAGQPSLVAYITNSCHDYTSFKRETTYLNNRYFSKANTILTPYNSFGKKKKINCLKIVCIVLHYCF